jgi:hypothetical protein
MEGTEKRMGRAAQHTAAAAVGKVKLAARGDTRAGILIGHGSLIRVDLSYSQTGSESAQQATENPQKKQIPRFARDDNYRFLEQPVGEPMERSDLTIARQRSGVRLGSSRQKNSRPKRRRRRSTKSDYPRRRIPPTI